MAVGEIGDIGKKRRDVGHEGVLKCGDGIEIEMAHGKIRCGRARRPYPRDLLRPPCCGERVQAIQVPWACAWCSSSDIETIAVLIGIHYADSDHGTSPKEKFARLAVRSD